MKKLTLCSAFVVLAWGAHLSLAQSTTDCSAVAEDMARLKCYDEQAALKKKAAATSTADTAATPAAPARSQPASKTPTASTAASTPHAATPSSDFGLDPEAVRRKQAAAHPDAPQAPEQIVGRVKSVVTKPRGQYRITLEDGQVWEETQHTGGSPPEAGDSVIIKRGMLGSYFLSRSVGLALRVKRID
jgi:hypothetical protein